MIVIINITEYLLKLQFSHVDGLLLHVYLYLCFSLCADTQANSSECLRQYGLSLLCSHIVLLTRTRACQLEAPPKPPPVPQWKLIRPPKEINVTDEPRSKRETEKEAGNEEMLTLSLEKGWKGENRRRMQRRISNT